MSQALRDLLDREAVIDSITLLYLATEPTGHSAGAGAGCSPVSGAAAIVGGYFECCGDAPSEPIIRAAE